MRALPMPSNVPKGMLTLALQDTLVSSAQVIHQALKVGKTLSCNRDLMVSLSQMLLLNMASTHNSIWPGLKLFP